jgi:hypothetical protein
MRYYYEGKTCVHVESGNQYGRVGMYIQASELSGMGMEHLLVLAPDVR